MKEDKTVLLFNTHVVVFKYQSSIQLVHDKGCKWDNRRTELVSNLARIFAEELSYRNMSLPDKFHISVDFFKLTWKVKLNSGMLMLFAVCSTSLSKCTFATLST